MGRGNYATSATAKVEIWRGPFFGFFVGKRRLLLLGGTEAIIEGGTEGLNYTMMEGGILLLPLKLLGFGGELVPRTFTSHTRKQ